MNDKQTDEKDLRTRLASVEKELTYSERAQEALSEQNQELAALLRLSNVFLSDRPKDLFEALLDVICEELKSPLGAIEHDGYQQDEPLMLRQMRQTGSWSREEANLAPPHNIWATPVREGKRTLIEDGAQTHQGTIPIRRVMCVPLISSGRVHGTITVANRPLTYDREQRELLESIATFIAPILENLLTQTSRELIRVQERKKWAETRVARGAALALGNVFDEVVTEATQARTALETGRPASGLLDRVLDRVVHGQAVVNKLAAFGHCGFDVPEPLDLNQIVAETVEQFSRSLDGDIGIDVVLEEGLDPVLADGGGAHLIVAELLENAADAITKEQGRIRVATETATFVRGDGEAPDGVAPGTYAVMTVSDTGIGIEPDVQRVIFEPFFTTQERGQGAGLGLTAAQSIARAVGGEITVSSAPAHGTTLRVFLPLAKKDTKIPSKQNTEPTAVLPATILIVDDEPVALRFMSSALQRSGYTVLEARNGEVALALIAEKDNQIDLLVTDIVMSPIDGTELVARLAATSPDLPVIYVSGYPGDWLSLQGSLSEEEMFLEKPFDSATLRRAVGTMLARCQAAES